MTNWRDGAHPEAGGAEVACEQLARQFVSRGWRVVYLTAAVAGRPSAEDVGGVRIVRRGGRLSVYLWALIWLLRHRDQVSAVVDSQNGVPFFTPLVVRRQTPVVLLLHHVHQDQFGMHFGPGTARVGRWLEGPFTRAVYGRRAIVTVSASTRQQVRLRLALRGDITVAPPGNDVTAAPLSGPVPSHPGPSHPGPSHPGPPSHPVPSRNGHAPGGQRRARSEPERIVYVGRLVPHKRVHMLVQMMPELLARKPRLELHIVGDGPSRQDLGELVSELGLSSSVKVYGAVPAAERDELMGTAWMSVNTSAAEGWCLSVLEANALGVPVLGLRRPGLSDSIRDGETGWLVDDEAELVAATLRALDELATPGAAEVWAERARAWACRFKWEEMAQRVEVALVAEQGRLAHERDDRRDRSDVATVVHLPRQLVPPLWSQMFRVSDTAMEDGCGLVVMLRGTDTAAARTALLRSGLPALVADDPSVRYSVARPADHVALTCPGAHSDEIVLTGP
jgi:glycosyltransferase involved in cell wall biosynthesis